MSKLVRRILRAVGNYDQSFCDMYEDAITHSDVSEDLQLIRRYLRERFGDQKLTILDAGCQAGRTVIPLVQDGHRLIGIDRSGFALRRARRHAKERGLRVRLHRGHISHLRWWVRPSGVDVVVCLGVLLTCRNYRKLLQLMADSVKPGGMLFVSHRPTIYYVASWLEKGRPELAAALARQTEGPSPDGHYHNWQTRAQLVELYRAQGLNVLGCHPLRNGPTRLDLSAVTDPVVRGLLEPAHQFDSTYLIPTHVLVVAHKPIEAKTCAPPRHAKAQSEELVS